MKRRVQVFGDDGLWTGRSYEMSLEDVERNLRPGEVAHDAVEFPQTKRSIDGVLVEYIPPPPDPKEDFVWDAESGRYRPTEAAARKFAERSDAIAAIFGLEAKQLRSMREAALGVDGALERLQDIENQIAELRKALQ
jgi:hypothetical protein